MTRVEGTALAAVGLALLLSLAHTDPVIGDDANLIAFVGERISVDEIPNKPDEIGLDLGFRARYQVLDVLYGDYADETIEFEAYDHFGYPEFAGLDTVLLFVSRGDGGFFHQKYLFQPVYRTVDGSWAGCGDPYSSNDAYRGDIRAESVDFEPEVRFETSGLSAAEVSRRYPVRYFEHRPNAAICKKGASAERLFEIMRSGVLAARGVFGDAPREDTCEFRIRTEAFDPEEHTLGYHADGRTVVSIDGAAHSGTDGSIPRHQIASIALDYGRSAVAFPRQSFADLFDPHLLCAKACRVPCPDPETPGLSLQGGDAAGAFRVEWRLDLLEGTLERRLFEHLDPETAVVTRYALFSGEE